MAAYSTLETAPSLPTRIDECMTALEEAEQADNANAVAALRGA
jgi:hypothetical protein